MENIETANNLHAFEKEVEVTYRGENYQARDNGAIWRRPRPNQWKRKLDEVWTFGNPSVSRGYMTIAGEFVHRIVATAFHGAQPSEKHVVDHIDTNRRNNRSENLRWVTRLENLLLNPITLKRIVSTYGSLDAFFANPQGKSVADYDWMRTVSKVEAEESRQRLLRWAESGQIPQGGQLGEWIFRNKHPPDPIVEDIPDIDSLTPNAFQRKWKTPTEFPHCPETADAKNLEEYAARLAFGRLFSRNKYGENITVVAASNSTLLSALVHMNNNPVKDWAVTKVTVEGNRFCHESMGTFFTLQGALKIHCELIGEPLEESIDDFA